ncbi:hypothetical protein DPMN_083518 [Dreissena polymorpha]|uniref:Uncharacterized protein n=1 Tax=Dreissena polymorpha TaxID=45954 RepID=A0A9D3YC35_DREPO|nr:hypothetical protein DPMN_083518 [Dreissena polymorpha]
MSTQQDKKKLSAKVNILIGLGGCLTTSYFISDVICAPQDHPIRSQLFCTTLFMSGLCTTFMPLLGIRLPVFQSVCSTFLVPLIGMRSDDRWNCKLLKEEALIELNQTSNTSLIQRIPFDANDEKEMFVRVREMMGCLLLASLLEVAVGATGLVGKALRFIGPLSVSVVVSLIGLSLYKIPLEYAQSHWPLTIM